MGHIFFTQTIQRFENEIFEKPNFQGNAVVNCTDDYEVPWT